MAKNVDDHQLNDRPRQVQERRWPNILKHCIIYLLIAALAVLVYQYSMAIQEVNSLKAKLLLDDKKIDAEVREDLAKCEQWLEKAEQMKARENIMNKELRYDACETDLAECQESLADSIDNKNRTVAICKNTKKDMKQTAFDCKNEFDECTKSRKQDKKKLEEAVTDSSKAKIELAECQESLADSIYDKNKTVANCKNAKKEMKQTAIDCKNEFDECTKSRKQDKKKLEEAVTNSSKCQKLLEEKIDECKNSRAKFYHKEYLDCKETLENERTVANTNAENCGYIKADYQECQQRYFVFTEWSTYVIFGLLFMVLYMSCLRNHVERTDRGSRAIIIDN